MPNSKILLTLVLSLSALVACEEKARESEVQPKKNPEAQRAAAAGQPVEDEVKVNRELLVQFGTLPANYETPKTPLTKERIELGKKLYFDKRFSKNQDVSCASCHSLATFGVDNLPTSEGHKKLHGGRNAPTVLNAAGHFLQFWDGRAADVEEQALGPVVNPVEMAMPNLAALEANLRAIPGYLEPFKAAFPGEAQPVNSKNFGLAVGAFERTLVTPSRFDKYLAGDDSALTAAEKKGLNEFLDVGCTTCHTGSLLGGREFKKMGQAIAWEGDDLGRHDVTKNNEDKQFFKVQSLRNIKETAPYFHDGSVASLEEAVRLMGKHQLGKNLSEPQTKSIVAFLGSLTGEISGDWAKEPELPESGPTLIKPNPN